MKEVLVTYMVIGDESNSSLTEMEPNFPYVLEPWAGRAAPRRSRHKFVGASADF